MLLSMSITFQKTIKNSLEHPFTAACLKQLIYNPLMQSNQSLSWWGWHGPTVILYQDVLYWDRHHHQDMNL